MDRDERRAAAREGILAAAHRQVAEGGCASASMAAVAARAGVAAGTLYRHFASRGELLAAVVGDALAAEAALLARRAAEGAEPPERLATWVRTAVTRRLAAPVLAHALLAEPVEREVEEARRAGLAAAEATLAGLLADGAAAGAWPAADHAVQAAAIDGALRAAVVGPAAQARLGPRPDADAEATALARFVAGAVGGPVTP